jgi:hypothetical protein
VNIIQILLIYNIFGANIDPCNHLGIIKRSSLLIMEFSNHLGIMGLNISIHLITMVIRYIYNIEEKHIFE